MKLAVGFCQWFGGHWVRSDVLERQHLIEVILNRLILIVLLIVVVLRYGEFLTDFLEVVHRKRLVGLLSLV